MPAGNAHQVVWLGCPRGSFTIPAVHLHRKANRNRRLGNALRTVASVLLMCGPRDLGIAVTEPPSTAGSRTSYLYDTYPGASALSAPLYRMAGKLLTQTAP